MPSDDPSDDAADEAEEIAAYRLQVIRAGYDGDVATAARARSHTEAVIREAAYSALARLGALDADALLAALHDDAPRVVRRGIELSAADGHLDAQVDATLVALVRGADAALAEVSAWALGERHEAGEDREDRTAPPEVLASLCEAATRHDDALVREAATAALGSVGDPTTAWAVLAACSDKATVRRRAVLALAAFDGPEIDDALRTAREDRDWQVRQAAEDLLAT